MAERLRKLLQNLFFLRIYYVYVVHNRQGFAFKR